MTKIITQADIDKIMAALMELNVPVKMYIGLQELFTKLPEQNAKPEIPTE
jgi:hypothetical protein